MVCYRQKSSADRSYGPASFASRKPFQACKQFAVLQASALYTSPYVEEYMIGSRLEPLHVVLVVLPKGMGEGGEAGGQGSIVV